MTPAVRTVTTATHTIHYVGTDRAIVATLRPGTDRATSVCWMRRVDGVWLPA